MVRTVPLLFLVLCCISAGAPPAALTSAPAFLDLNRDGIISDSERQAYADSRSDARAGDADRWDANGDGVVDEVERQLAVEALKALMDAKVASLFAKLAGDDALLTLDEFSTLPRFANTPSQLAESLFNRLDADQNGSVTLTEFFRGTGRGDPPNEVPAAKRTSP